MNADRINTQDGGLVVIVKLGADLYRVSYVGPKGNYAGTCDTFTRHQLVNGDYSSIPSIA